MANPAIGTTERERIRKWKAAHPDWSSRRIADKFGIHHKTANRILRENSAITVAEPPRHEEIRKVLKKGPATTEQLAKHLDAPIRLVEEAIKDMKNKGALLLTTIDGRHDLGDSILLEPGKSEVRGQKGEWTHVFGFVTDNHLCFPPNTRVETSTGPVRISQIKEGDLVLTHKGRFKKVLRSIRSQSDGRFIRLSFRSSNKGGTNAYASLTATPRHPVLVHRNEEDVWVPIEEVTEGDIVRVLGKKCKYCENKTAPWLEVCNDCDPFVSEKNYAQKNRVKERLSAPGSRHYAEDIVPEMDKWEADGWRTIPVDRARPDFIAIKNGRIVAVEVESPLKNRPRPMKEKYALAGVENKYDEIIWIEKDPRTKTHNREYPYHIGENEFGFIGCRVNKVEEVLASRSQNKTVYNLEVEEDNSYVAKRCVVHNCNRHSRLDVLNAAYDHFERLGIKRVYNAGNWIDGEARFNKTELIVAPGLDNQLDYMIDKYPVKDGIETHYIAGDDHEGWHQQREGIEVGKYLQNRAEDQGRHDLKYLGYGEADIKLSFGQGSSVMRVVHPGGGSAYAISYTDQKRVESYQGGEKPQIELVGHYHKFNYGYPREVHTVQGGCTTDQSLFMRKKRLQAHVGYSIIRIKQDETGAVAGFQVQWNPFFDRGFYEKRFS